VNDAEISNMLEEEEEDDDDDDIGPMRIQISDLFRCLESDDESAVEETVEVSFSKLMFIEDVLIWLPSIMVFVFSESFSVFRGPTD